MRSLRVPAFCLGAVLGTPLFGWAGGDLNCYAADYDKLTLELSSFTVDGVAQSLPPAVQPLVLASFGDGTALNPDQHHAYIDVPDPHRPSQLVRMYLESQP